MNLRGKKEVEADKGFTLVLEELIRYLSAFQHTNMQCIVGRLAW